VSNQRLDGTDAINANNTYNLWRINTDGSGVTPLTQGTIGATGSFNPAPSR